MADVDTPLASNYEIGPSDVLTISVFQVQELNTDAQVAQNGTIMLPLIGSIKVAGKQPQEVKREIAKKLSGKYLQSPQVNVLVKESNSQRIVVSGAVVKPGSVPMTGNTTLMSAIADSKGFTEVADMHSVMVFRSDNGRKYGAHFDVADIQSGKTADPRLTRGDVVVVDTSDLKTGIKTFLPAAGAGAGLYSRF